jgi:asparagine synthase (glutamine-hydrolysing)
MAPGRWNAPTTAATGLCGWFGAIDPQGPAEAALARMAGTFDGNTEDGRSATTDGAALHLTPSAPAADLVADGWLLAAIDGYPQWSDPELAARAVAGGHAAALAEAYRRHGPELLAHLRGPFAIAVLEPERRRALLAIDRMGIHPLCYARCGDGRVVFGSTTTSVTAHPTMTATVSPQAVFDYLFFYRVPAPTTIFVEQQKLLPAQYLLVEAGSARTGFYWEVPYGDRNGADLAELKEALFERLHGAVDHAVANEDRGRLGAFLSGGLDSSTVTGLLSAVGDGPVKAFTIGFDCAGYDETEYAAAAAGHFGAEHHIYRATPDDVCDLIPRVAEAYDEPFGNSSVVPTFFCARLARENGVEMLLAGDGGDEIFAGNELYVWMKTFELYGAVPAVVRRQVIEPLVFGIPDGDWIGPLRRARNYINRRPQLALVAGARRVLAPDVVDSVDPTQPLAILRDVYDRARSASPLQRMLHVDRQVLLADNDLRKVNRMCALSGIRVRYPLLDDDVVELSAKVPPDLLMRGLKRRYFFRRAVENYLPQKVLNKSKHGFGLPYGPWLKSWKPLREIALDSLEALKRRGYVRADYVDGLVHRSREDDGPRRPSPACHGAPVAAREIVLRGDDGYIT